MLDFSIFTIVTFVTVLNELVKYLSQSLFNRDIKKYIPLFSILFGIILGVTGYFMDDVDMGNNILEAIFIGIAAGSSATGLNQIGKQLDKNNVQITNSNDIDLIKYSDKYTKIYDNKKNKRK